MKSSTLDDYKERILKVLVHIQRNLDEDLSLEELAGVACFSAYHFHRVFTGMVGESLKEHVRRLRLERAAVQLKLSRRPVTRIAFDAGYQAHEAFTRAFKSAYGLAPVRFRSRRRPRPIPAAPSGVHYREGGELRDFRALRSGLPNMEVRIEERQPMQVAFLRHLGPYQEVGGVWDRLLPMLGKEGLIGGDSLFIGI